MCGEKFSVTVLPCCPLLATLILHLYNSALYNITQFLCFKKIITYMNTARSSIFKA